MWFGALAFYASLRDHLGTKKSLCLSERVTSCF
jgi:hypothetical protein